jgi:hypothetical protein
VESAEKEQNKKAEAAKFTSRHPQHPWHLFAWFQYDQAIAHFLCNFKDHNPFQNSL